MKASGISQQYVPLDTNSLKEFVGSKHSSVAQKNAVVSQQFESLLVKQFLNEALQPMIKGVFNEDSEGHRFYRHFLTDSLSENIVKGGGFGISSILQQQLGNRSNSQDYTDQSK
jgi:Rod binding domain-containing protein